MRATRGTALSLILLLVAALLAYHNSFSGDFVFDDESYIVKNPSIRKLWPLWETLFAIPGERESRPLLNLSLAFNYRLGGLNPWGYHAFNLAVHVLASFLLFFILRTALRWGPAFSISLLWLVHPLQTESVTYVIQRSESMMGLFYLAALYAFILGTTPRGRKGWLKASILFSCLGMLAKPVMVTVPVSILLYDRCFVTGSFFKALARRLGFYLALFSTTLLAAGLMLQAQARHGTGTWFTYSELTPLKYAALQPGVILKYLKLCVWPHPLVLDYAWPLQVAREGVLIPGLILGALFVLALWATVAHPRVGFVGLAFFLILAPTSGFIPLPDPAFEHRMYLPLACVATLATLAVYWALNKWAKPERRRLILCSAFAMLPALVLGVLTVARNLDYQSDAEIWRDTVEKRPANARAHYNLGFALLHSAQYEEAAHHLKKALALKAEYPDAHNALGLVESGRRNPAEAMKHYREALSLSPRHVDALTNMGGELSRTGRFSEAEEYLRKALEANPAHAQAYNNLGNVYFEQGRLKEAAGYYREALALDPALEEAGRNLGQVLLMSGHGGAASESTTFGDR